MDSVVVSNGLVKSETSNKDKRTLLQSNPSPVSRSAGPIPMVSNVLSEIGWM